MRTIYKYPFMVAGEFEIAIPGDAQFLTVQLQARQPCMWWQVNTERPASSHRFAVVGTGHPLPDGGDCWLDYLGTFQQLDGALVWHLFEFVPSALAETGETVER